MNLNKIKVQVNRDEIVNYYIAKYLIFNHDNLMKNFSKFLEDPTKNFDSYILSIFMSMFIKIQQNKILNK